MPRKEVAVQRPATRPPIATIEGGLFIRRNSQGPLSACPEAFGHKWGINDQWDSNKPEHDQVGLVRSTKCEVEGCGRERTIHLVGDPIWMFTAYWEPGGFKEAMDHWRANPTDHLYKKTT